MTDKPSIGDELLDIIRDNDEARAVADKIEFEDYVLPKRANPGPPSSYIPRSQVKELTGLADTLEHKARFFDKLEMDSIGARQDEYNDTGDDLRTWEVDDGRMATLCRNVAEAIKRILKL